MPAEVVAELARQVVDAFFFGQAVGGVVFEVKNAFQSLKKILTAFGINEIDLFAGVLDTLARLHIDKRNAATLIVGEVNEVTASAHALFPWYTPLFTRRIIGSQIASVEARLNCD